MAAEVSAQLVPDPYPDRRFMDTLTVGQLRVVSELTLYNTHTQNVVALGEHLQLESGTGQGPSGAPSGRLHLEPGTGRGPSGAPSGGVYIWNPALARGQPVRHQSVKFIQQFELTECML